MSKLRRFFDKHKTVPVDTTVNVRVCPSTSGAKRDISMSDSILAWAPALPPKKTM